MSGDMRASASRRLVPSESTSFQDQGPFTVVAGDAPNTRMNPRIRFWISTIMEGIILIGCILSLIFISKLWLDFQCRVQDHVSVPLPCTPLDMVVYPDVAQRSITREIWCSEPVIYVDPKEYDCSTLRPFGESSPVRNVTCYTAQVSYRAWFTKEENNSLRVGYRSPRPEVSAEMTRVFTFKCSDTEPKTPTDYPAPIERSIAKRDYPLVVYA